MGTKRLYVLAIPGDALTGADNTRQRNTAQHGFVNQSGQSVESISQQPGTRRLRGAFRGAFAEDMAQELTELADTASFGHVPYFDEAGQTPDEGYYTMERSVVNPADPRMEYVHPFDVSLSKAGTRNTSWRTVELSVSNPSTPFGVTDRAYVGVPGAATKVRWMNTESGATQSAVAVDTVSAEYGSVDRFDAYSAPYEPETRALVYDLDYAEEGKVDVSIWDTRGLAKHDANNVRQWMHVFDPSHVFEGEAVIDTGRLRLTMDDTAQTMSATQWDAGTSTWTSVTLGTSDYELYDLDITYNDGSRVDAQLLFEDSVGGGTYGLDASFLRGYDAVMFTTPENQSGAIPAGLDTLLAPIADTATHVADPTKTLTDRSEVRL